VGDKTFIIEATGDEEKISALEKLLAEYGLLEMVRTGKVVLIRGSRTT
jgi:acetolactate synthase-1/3 small subunit